MPFAPLTHSFAKWRKVGRRAREFQAVRSEWFAGMLNRENGLYAPAIGSHQELRPLVGLGGFDSCTAKTTAATRSTWMLNISILTRLKQKAPGADVDETNPIVVPNSQSRVRSLDVILPVRTCTHRCT